MTPTTDVNSPITLLPQLNSNFTTDEQLSLISRIAAASIGSQGTVGGLVIAGVVSYLISYLCIFYKVKLIINTILIML